MSKTLNYFILIFANENLQAKAVRFIKMNFNSSYKLILDDCNKYPLYVVRIKRFIELVYTVAHDKCPIYLNDLIKPKIVPINPTI